MWQCNTFWSYSSLYMLVKYQLTHHALCTMSLISRLLSVGRLFKKQKKTYNGTCSLVGHLQFTRLFIVPRGRPTHSHGR